jgi:DNA-binding GntR family transcriptional regulator
MERLEPQGRRAVAPGGRPRRLRVAISREPLRGEVRRRLLEGLIHGDPAPGTGIQEAALAAELGVSRTPLREALLSLEQEGLLRSEPGRGFFVPPLTVEDAREIYPMLGALEGLSLRLAAPLTPERAADLTRLNGELAAAEGDPERALELDRRWHARLLERSGSRRLRGAIEVLKGQAYRYEYAYMRDSGRVATSVAQHEQILAALAEGNVDGAVRRLEENWRVSLDFLTPWLLKGGAA